ncbi:ABC transporter permease [Clostridium sp. 19966]|uniref:ABC transporter permease n=1 Tax=Clostridium sp. 19966 TaxID=2768166 RepID=UPI0028DFB739|nr:ABC transporter permease [Clostridium sp. 19966]MDT8717337.1 ABC transporter permease [Clostridium sp. 19966]
MKLAWKEISYNKKKYILIELILIMMIFMVIFLSGLANGLARAVSAGIENADALNYAVSSDSENLITVSSLDENVLATVKNSTSSKVTTLNIQRMNLNKKGGTKRFDVAYFAINPEEFLNPKVTEGEKLTDKTNAIVLDESLQDSEIKVGDIVEDSATGIELTVVGFTKDEMYGHSPIGFISMDTYKELQQAENPMYKTKYNAIAIEGSDISKIKVKDVQVVDKSEIVENIPGYKAEQMTIKMILWVLVFVSAAVLGVFFYIITLQKRKEFGVMKAIGMKLKEIAATQVAQVLILACFGVIIGNALAFGMASVLPKSMPFYLKFTDSSLISAAFILISMICSLVSIREVAKVDPITIIGGN